MELAPLLPRLPSCIFFWRSESTVGVQNPRSRTRSTPCGCCFERKPLLATLSRSLRSLSFNLCSLTQKTSLVRFPNLLPSSFIVPFSTVFPAVRSKVTPLHLSIWPCSIQPGQVLALFHPSRSRGHRLDFSFSLFCLSVFPAI